MQRDQDAATGATYFTLSDHPVSRTVHVADLVMVDVDDSGEPVGVEFAFDPANATRRELAALWLAFPDLEQTLAHSLAPIRVADIAVNSDSAEGNTAWQGSGFRLHVVSDTVHVEAQSTNASGLPHVPDQIAAIS